MSKSNFLFMDLNKETAMRLWNKTFGKETKAYDFAGRMMAKGAYNDRKSEFGWNVDHILPQSKGGVTADHNLVCCHIKTNDEKADKFPCFIANGMRFELIKVQNHYEICMLDDSLNESEKEKDEVNFFDHSSVISLFKDFKGLQTKKRMVGSVQIILEGINGASTAITDIIETLFQKENIIFNDGNHYITGSSVKIIIKDYELEENDNISELLDKCILLNTYLGHYFIKIGTIDGFSIAFRIDEYNDREMMYREDSLLYFPEQVDSMLRLNSLVINKLNDVKRRIKDFNITNDMDSYYEYPIIFKELAKNLDKEVNGK